MEAPPALLEMIENSIQFIYSFGPIFEPTVVLVPEVVVEAVKELSISTGQDYDTLRQVLGLFACYPLGIIMGALPYGKTKHLFSFLLGTFLLQFTLGVQWIHQLITSLVCYGMFLTLPRKTTISIVPIFVMLYITLGHIHRQYIDYLGYTMDFTGAQMVITIKMYSFAYNLYDGEMIAKGTPDRASKKCAPFAIEKLPGLLEFLGFTFCFSNVLTGPAFEYSAYANACSGELLYTPDGKPRGKIPGRLIPCLKPLLLSFLVLGIHVVGSSYFPIHDTVDAQNNTPIIITEEFMSNSIFYRYGYMWIGLFFTRFKYYFAWKNAEGANNVWYAGFDGFDDKGNALGWETSNNIDILGFELAQNFKSLSAAWNKKTANWLGRYVYMRTNGSLIATYSLSAFWHGFYPGYYIFFLSTAMLTFCERIGRKKLTPLFHNAGDPKWSLYGIACCMATSFVAEYSVIGFIVLAWEWTYNTYKSFYFIGHIIPFVFYIVLSAVPSPKKDPKKKD